MVDKRVWFAVGAGIVLVVAGVATAAALSTATADPAVGSMALTGSAACESTDTTTSTITWTLENRSSHPATLLGFDGTEPVGISQSPSGTEIPAAGPGGPGTVTFTQVLAGTGTAGLTATVGWEFDESRSTTSEVTVQGKDCRVPVSVGELTATQPDCAADDPGLDGTLLVEGAGDGVRFEVSADGGTPVVMYPGERYNVILEKEPVTAVVTPIVDDDQRLDGFDPGDWTVTFALPADSCS
ncbi:hypothetical protein B7R21_00250 [Subtercola boreus]|uniref:Ig-like domain-containing protein n=1 Tax=Subtercola boreus TaxID=120213 RepID=A0A3E0W4G7_9MICO|nr:hypothetical protein [Subtercola boreus]RFA17212.1 hypothetical protein B7R21_00250 [Subtercola boreus]